MIVFLVRVNKNLVKELKKLALSKTKDMVNY